MTDLCETMISIPKRFVGFRSATSVLEDRSLSRRQKQNALLAWRARLRKVPQPVTAGEDLEELIEEIDEALRVLNDVDDAR
ncbi:hypothetical protein [Roseibium sp. M-1]